jgi:site-specific DNA-cytosine methylase
MQVVDLFCGLGGFSAGAIDAGATVILGADKDSVPLKLWAANVPGGRAKLATLGKDGGAIELPPPSPSIHVHLSPPCTDLSPARNGSVHSAAAADVEGGVRMLRWALDVVLERGDHSWSLENVSTPTTRAVLTEYADRFPGRVGFATLDAAEFGAAQTRTRLIAAPPKLIELLQEMPSARRISVREAFANDGIEVPTTHFKNQTRNRDGTACVRSVEEQSFTVCASHGLTWCDREGKTHKVMTARESAILMGFGSAWRLPKGSRNAQRAVGNALCVAMSKAIVQAAVALCTGTPIPTAPLPISPLPGPPAPTSPPKPPEPPDPPAPQTLAEQPSSTASPALPHEKTDRSSSKRLRTIESLIRGLHDASPSQPDAAATEDWLG